MANYLCKGTTKAGNRCDNFTTRKNENYCCKAHAASDDATWFGKPAKRKKKGRKVRCIAITKKGARCKIHSRTDTGYCKVHRKQARKASRPQYQIEVDAVGLEIGTKVIDPEIVIPRRRIEYAKYLKTAHWKRVKKIIRYIYQDRCQICGKSKKLHVHHNRYKNLWHEELTDVILLCEKCHNKHHNRLQEAS